MAQRFGRRVISGMRQRIRAGFLRTKLTKRKRGSSDHGVTHFQDSRFVYRKKSMGRSKKRRWKKFKNKVLAVSEKDLGSRTVVFNNQYTWTNNQATFEGMANVGLYTGRYPGGVNPYSDLAVIANSENISNPSASAGSTVDKSTKFIFKSACLDVTMTNMSGVSNGTAYEPDSRMILEVDVYEMSASRSFNDTSSNFADITNVMVNGFANTKTIGAGVGGGSGFAATGGSASGGGTNCNMSRGLTPWDNPLALSQYGLKIWKKRKYFIQSGQTITYQIRDPKRHVLELEAMLNYQNGGNFPKMTKWLFIVYKSVPNGVPLGVVGTAGNGQESLLIGQTRKYFYKIEGINEDRDEYYVA